MVKFEKLLAEVSSGVERFVRYRLPSQTDADDVLQEVYLSAYCNFPNLKNKESFKPWIISIARNKCNDYFRAKGSYSVHLKVRLVIGPYRACASHRLRRWS